ncbi:MAG TPA: hypothetical protein VKZ89_01900 [Thermobifida alba]|nr:hypothetical protein [Thermobifida alba]
MTWNGVERAIRFALGVAIVWHQAVIATKFNPYVLAAGMTLVGAGEAIRRDIARRSASSRGGRRPQRSSRREGPRAS